MTEHGPLCDPLYRSPFARWINDAIAKLTGYEIVADQNLGPNEIEIDRQAFLIRPGAGMTPRNFQFTTARAAANIVWGPCWVPEFGQGTRGLYLVGRPDARRRAQVDPGCCPHCHHRLEAT